MQRALYISPVLPRRHGHGLARRAYRVIEALSHRYRVSLLTTERAEARGTEAADAMSLCDDITVLPLRQWPGAALRRVLPERYYAWYGQPSDWLTLSRADQPRLAVAYPPDRFDLVHVLRLRMLPLLRGCPALAQVPAWLDLDDIESITRERLAVLARLNGDSRIAYVMQQDAEAYRAIERRELTQFERLFVCSEADRSRLIANAGPPRVDVLPNVVDIPEQLPDRTRGEAGTFVFLFVGTLDYYPNRDAVAFFCREVAPLIRHRTSRPFQIRLVADGGRARQRQVPRIPEVSWAPDNADLDHEYAAADAAVVPIRAGGGTRIKALEAFAHRTAVIATTIGVEGLDVAPGVHALIGDTATDLAAHAVAVMADATLRERLAEQAFALVQTAYSPAVLSRCLEEVSTPCA